MLKYVIKRILYIVPTLILVSILAFAFVRMIPGDPAQTMLGELASEEQLEAYRDKMGLNDSVIRQYLIFLSNALKGDVKRYAEWSVRMTERTPGIDVRLNTEVRALPLNIFGGMGSKE